MFALYTLEHIARWIHPYGLSYDNASVVHMSFCIITDKFTARYARSHSHTYIHYMHDTSLEPFLQFHNQNQFIFQFNICFFAHPNESVCIKIGEKKFRCHAIHVGEVL